MTVTTENGLLGSTEPLAVAYDGALVDLDGVAYKGTDPVPWAAEGLGAARAAGMSVTFVTNNASREPQSVADQLTSLGIPTAADEVMTAAQSAALLLADSLPAGAAVLVVGGPGLHTAVEHAGLRIVHSADDAPVAVVQGFGPQVGWPQLAEATYAVRNGAWYVASNLDLTLPTERGFAPGNGSLVAVVRSATGIDPVSAGKPERAIFHRAAEVAGARRPLIVGDRLDTDLRGARASGFPGLHVLTGVHSARDAALAPASDRPSFLGVDLRSLTAPHPAPQRLADGWWRCGGAVARVLDGALELADGGAEVPSTADGLDPARAACAAVWAAVDGGQVVDDRSVPEL